jgi:preprotein translocase subunit SecY
VKLSLLNLFRIPEIRRKIFITLSLLLVYRVGFFIPLPGINVDALNALSEQRSKGGLSSLFGMMNVLTGADIESAMLFSLGVMPYISASIIFSLLTKVNPTLERLSKEGQSGQKKINQYTRLATVPICIIQSLFVILGGLNKRVTTGNVQVPLVRQEIWDHYYIPYVLLVMIALTAGTMFIMWIGEQITEHGIGNGISLIIMAGIIAQLPRSMMKMFGQPGLSGDQKVQDFLLFVAAWVVAVAVIVYITKGTRRIPIQQAKLTRGRQVYGGQRHFLPLKVNQAGVMPIIFASTLLLIPYVFGMGLTAISPRLAFLQDAFQDHSGFWYMLTYTGLIFFFAFFWTSLMFQPNEMANNLKEYGSFIPGIRPGKRTAEYLESVMIRITLAGAAFLAFIAILPTVVTRQLHGLDPEFAYFLGGTSILIVVGVALDLVEKLNGLLVMRNYDGFLKSGETAGWGRKAR